MDSKNSNNIDDQAKSRRGFIKKSSIVAGISILPASNVWGTCNVSGVSGGSQTVNSTCVVPNLSGGLPLVQWHTLTKTTITETEKRALANVVSDLKFDDVYVSTSKNKAEDYYTRLNAVLQHRRMAVNGGGHFPDLRNLSFYEAIRSTDHHERVMGVLAANVAFGFTQREGQFAGPGGFKLLLDHVWGSLKIGPMGEVSRLESQFTGGTITEGQLETRLSNVEARM